MRHLLQVLLALAFVRLIIAFMVACCGLAGIIALGPVTRIPGLIVIAPGVLLALPLLLFVGAVGLNSFFFGTEDIDGLGLLLGLGIVVAGVFWWAVAFIVLTHIHRRSRRT